MIRHIVLISFAPELPESEIADIFANLHRIRDKMDGIISITSGRSESPEKIERGYRHGFVVDFTNWEALETYQQHPDHTLLGERLVANAVGGVEGILVFDLPVADAAGS